MNNYQVLREHIKHIARNPQEEKDFVELVMQHFEGRCVFDTMPDILKIALSEWENEEAVN